MACTCTPRSYCRFDGIIPESTCAECERAMEDAEVALAGDEAFDEWAESYEQKQRCPCPEEGR